MSVLHTAIEAAAIMGAKYITLVGCEHGGLYARCCGLEKYYAPGLFLPYPKVDPRLQNGTIWLAELFQPHGIKVRRYFYKKTKNYPRGYQKIRR